MGQTYFFAGHYSGPDNITTFTGTPAADDLLIATFEGESSAEGLVTDFTQHADGSFTATYRTTQPGSADSVTISGIENVSIHTTNTYTFEGNQYHQAVTDVIRTGRGDDIIWSYFGNDIIDAGAGVDQVNGGEGQDGLAKEFGSTAAAVTFNLYNNTFAGAGSYSNLEYFIDLKTGAGGDIIDTTAISAGTRGNDLISTRAGNDRVTVRHGQDSVDLGAGNDRLIVDWREASFTNNTFMTLNGTASGYSGSYAGTQSGAASVTFAGVEHFTIYTMTAGGNGTNLADDIVTGDGNDIVSTYISNDRIQVGRGTDQVDGGVGIDGLGKDFGPSAGGVKFNLYNNGYSGPGSYTNLEYFIDLKTGSGNDRIDTTAANAADLIDTSGGNDVVTVRHGQDSVNLGEGSDRLIVDWREASFTNNTFMTLNGNPSGYSGSYAGTQSGAASVAFTGVEHFTIYTMVTGGNGSNLRDTIVTGAGNDVIYTYASSDNVQSGAGNDTVDGGVSGDLLDGGDGNDDLRGGTGNDTLTGGNGDDRFFADSTFDTIIELANGGNDIVYTQANFTLAANVERLALQGTSDLNGTGNDLGNLIAGNTGANLIQGLAGNDVLNGNDGTDTLAGGAGNDTMSGGSQADVFRFTTALAGADRIEDFNKNADRFDLGGGSFDSAAVFGADTILHHDGGTIRMVGVNTLSLAQWNALVLPGGAANGEDGAPVPFAAWPEIGLLQADLLPVDHGAWLFA